MYLVMRAAESTPDPFFLHSIPNIPLKILRKFYIDVHCKKLLCSLQRLYIVVPRNFYDFFGHNKNHIFKKCFNVE